MSGEIPLTGGGVNVVTRIGDTVRRPVHPWTTVVHELLNHLAAQGFTGAPHPRGFDSAGREILSFIPGDAGNYPLSAQVRSVVALTSAAQLLRRYHDATVGFGGLHAEGWQFGALNPVEVVCHGDFAPYNCVFTGARAIALIDFDTARPGPRAWDLAYALYRFAPLTHPDNSDGFGTVQQQAARARMFLDAYGASQQQRAATVDMLAPRLQALVNHMREAADDGDPASASHIATGHADLYLGDITHIEAHRAMWAETVIRGR